MRAFPLAVFCGVLGLLVLPELPSGWWIVAILAIALPAAWRWRSIWLICPAVLAFAMTWCWAYAHLSTQLDQRLEGKTVRLIGRIESLPQRAGPILRFIVRVDSLVSQPAGIRQPHLVRLSWYRPANPVHAGERWRFQVRLKRPHGFMNPGGMDYEGWLFSKGIDATGYVYRGRAHKIGPAPNDLIALRSTLARQIDDAVPESPFAGVLVALATGNRNGISRSQWQVFRATGTSHLLAISGLHIGLVAGWLFALVYAVWRRISWLTMRMPASQAAGVAGSIGALLYAALAGFSLPTERAVVMLGVFTVAGLMRRRIRPSSLLALALLGVLVLDPGAPLSPGFWLSFGAVAVILYALSGHVNRKTRWDWIRLQAVLTLGLLPFTLLFFQQVSVAGPLANLVAIPVFGLLVVPLDLLGSLLLQCWPWAGKLLFSGAVWILAKTWLFLAWLAALPWAQWEMMRPTPAALVLGLFSIPILLAPRGIPGRWLGLVLWLPLFFPGSRLPEGAYRFTLLDVGQGLSAVVETSHHSLVFDTGASFRSGTDVAGLVILPYLYSKMLASPSILIVSHEDNDHAGGLATLRKAFPAAMVLSGALGKFRDVVPCVRGEHWRWDGVQFKILYPDSGAAARGNNASCVLRITGKGGSVLLTGDIEAAAEHRLVTGSGLELRSDILVVPHHGSNTSSTPAFISAVFPRIALFPVGYRNRWGFPRHRVVQRYRNIGAQILDTAHTGAVSFLVRQGKGVVMEDAYRIDHRHFWNWPQSGCCGK